MSIKPIFSDQVRSPAAILAPETTWTRFENARELL